MHSNKTTKMFKEFPVIALSEQELFPGFCPDHFLACAHQKQVIVKVTPEDFTNTYYRWLILPWSNY